MRRLAAYGASTAPTPAAAARSADVVLVTVEDWSATRAVLLGPDGALTAGPLTGVLIATSTAAPEDLAVLAERTTAILDVGVLGGHRHAAAGRLQLYVGGRADVVARVQPWLNLLGRPVQHVGDLGGGVRLKLIMNFLVGVHVQVLAEAVALADGVDLDRRLLLDVITRNGLHHPLLGLTALRLSAEDYSAADFRLRLMAKELNLAVATARQAGVELPLAEAAQRAHDTALTLGLGDEDCAAIARAMSPQVDSAPPYGIHTRPRPNSTTACRPATPASSHRGAHLGDSGCEPGGGVTLGGSLCRRPLPGGGVERVTVDDQPRISQELGELLELLRGHAGGE